jgi:hypothetical protein
LYRAEALVGPHFHKSHSYSRGGIPAPLTDRSRARIETRAETRMTGRVASSQARKNKTHLDAQIPTRSGSLPRRPAA